MHRVCVMETVRYRELVEHCKSSAEFCLKHTIHERYVVRWQRWCVA
jgi:hypothetical protein